MIQWNKDFVCKSFHRNTSFQMCIKIFTLFTVEIISSIFVVSIKIFPPDKLQKISNLLYWIYWGRLFSFCYSCVINSLVNDLIPWYNPKPRTYCLKHNVLPHSSAVANLLWSFAPPAPTLFCIVFHLPLHFFAITQFVYISGAWFSFLIN